MSHPRDLTAFLPGLGDFTLKTASKVDVLDVAADRGLCCHVGGDIDFDIDIDIDIDAAGNLYLSTGDDSNPFDSAGYSPIDERTDRNPGYDAQRSAGNTNDLRGKVLRIKVNTNGAARPTTRFATPARPPCLRPGRPGSGTPAPRPSSAAAPSPRWVARSTTTVRP